MGGHVYGNKPSLLSRHWEQSGNTPDILRRGVLLCHCHNRSFPGCPIASPLGISAGVAGCSQSIPSSVPAGPHHPYEVAARQSTQPAPSPEIFISALRRRHRIALNLPEYFIPRPANGTGDVPQPRSL